MKSTIRVLTAIGTVTVTKFRKHQFATSTFALKNDFYSKKTGVNPLAFLSSI